MLLDMLEMEQRVGISLLHHRHCKKAPLLNGRGGIIQLE
jgi:hypothetical protein